MEGFLATILSFPTLLFTVPVLVSLIYWMFVIVGAVDIEIFDSISGGGELAEGAVEGVAEGAVEGVAEGAVEGVAEGAADGVAEGVLEGAADGAADGAVDGVVEGADGAVDGAASSGLATVLSLLRIGKVPITITFSVIFLIGWMVSGVSMSLAHDLLAEAGLVGTLIKTGVAIASFMAGGAIASVITRPLETVFSLHEGAAAVDLVGETARLATSSLADDFGQASINYQDADLLVQVRCREPNDLGKGDAVEIVAYDIQNHLYWVEPKDRPATAALPASTSAPPPVEEVESDTETLKES